MRIACPACATEYEVPDRLLAGPARTLRCSRCAAEFPLPQGEAAPLAEPVQPPPPPPPVPPADVAEPPLPSAAPPVPERTPTTADPEWDRTLVRAWVASLAIVAGATVVLVVFREAIMAAWPPAMRLFAALGLA